MRPASRPPVFVYWLLPAALCLGGCGEQPRVYEVTHREPAAPANAPSSTGPAPAAVPVGTPASAAPFAGAGGPMAGQALPASALAGAEVRPPAWQLPAGWVEAPGNPARRASYTVAGTTPGSVDISVTVFPGDVGGELANLNRWRGQLGLPPLAAADAPGGGVARLATGAGAVTVADFTSAGVPPGKAAPQRMLAAIVPRAGHTWFFRLAGDAPQVGPQAEAFRAWVASIQFAE